VGPRNPGQLAGDPGVVEVEQVELGHDVGPVAVEAGGNEHQFGGEVVEGAEPMVVHRLAEGAAVGAGGQRAVDHVGGGFAVAGERVGGVLEGGQEQDALVAGNDALGTVAVVDVEIGDGHAGKAVRLEGVIRGDGDVVEKAESHR